MSVPFYSLSCTDCQYSDTYGYAVLYKVDGVELPIWGLLTDGWCFNCDKVLRIFSYKSSLAITLNEIDKGNKFIEDLSTGVIGKILNAVSKERKRALAYIEADNNKLEQWKLFLNSHSVCERCLTCGATNVMSVKLPTEYLIPTAIGVTHSCGGGIMAISKGSIRYGEGGPTVICDIEGNIIRDDRR